MGIFDRSQVLWGQRDSKRFSVNAMRYSGLVVFSIPGRPAAGNSLGGAAGRI